MPNSDINVTISIKDAGQITAGLVLLVSEQDSSLPGYEESIESARRLVKMFTMKCGGSEDQAEDLAILLIDLAAALSGN